MAHDREVAGIRCGEVLERLSDYVDGDLTDAERARIDGHLTGCDWCERFGGAFAATFGRLRQGLADAPVTADLRSRLDAALDEA